MSVTSSDALLLGLGSMTVSLMIFMVNPVFDYVLAIVLSIIYIMLLLILPWFLLVLAVLGSVEALQRICDDVQVTRTTLAAWIAFMMVLTFFGGAVRSFWPVIRGLYTWNLDVDQLASSVAPVSRFIQQSMAMSGVVSFCLAGFVELFQQPLFGIEPRQEYEPYEPASSEPV